MNHMLAVYWEGKAVAMHRISERNKEMVIQPQHYADIHIRERKGAENPLMEQECLPPLQDLSRYDEALYG